VEYNLEKSSKIPARLAASLVGQIVSMFKHVKELEVENAQSKH
jgi:hypothetical protein